MRRPARIPAELVPLAQEAERLGYDSVWAAEAWGTDAVTVLAWIAASHDDDQGRLGDHADPGRTPANTAMTAATLDLMSGGRFILGLGTSGPQVVEGWHGQPWGKPLGKTREYVEIVRAALRREVVEHHGRALPHPVRRPRRDRARQAAEADAAPAARRHPDLPRRDRPEERRARRRDRRRLAADLRRPGALRRRVRPEPRRRARRLRDRGDRQRARRRRRRRRCATR